jgi:hypothetical protein
MKLAKPNGNYQSMRTSLLTALLVGTLLAQNAGAQSAKEAVLNASAIAPATTTAAADVSALVAKSPASALLAVDQNRGSIIETIVNFWQADASANKDASVRATEGAELRATLSSLRADHLLAASNARTLDGLKQIFVFADAGIAANKDADSTKSGQKNATAPASIGSLASDTTYTPITPCKLVDTRGTSGYAVAGGAFAASEKRTYNSYSSCGPTVQNMAAIQVSAVTSYGGAGGGILSMMANTAAAPITNIFYAGYAPVTTTIPVNGTSPGGLFDVQVSGVAGAHVILEVVGYFAAPTPTALQCVNVDAFGAASTWNNATTKSVSFPACTAGYTRTGVSCGFNGTAPAGVLLQEGSASFNYCQWYNNSGAVQSANVTNLQAVSTCCRVPGR